MSNEGIEHWKAPVVAGAGMIGFDATIDELLGIANLPGAPVKELHNSLNQEAGHSCLAEMTDKNEMTGKNACPPDLAVPLTMPAGEADSAKIRAVFSTSLPPVESLSAASGAEEFSVEFHPESSSPQPLEDTVDFQPREEEVKIEEFTPFSENKKIPTPPAEKTALRWIFNLIAYLISAALGLTLGYYLLRFIDTHFMH
jgi:hypothetical protein